MSTDNGCYFYVAVTDPVLVEKALRATCLEMEIGARDFILLPAKHGDESIPPGIYIYEDDAYDCRLINDAGLPRFAIHLGAQVLFYCSHESIPLVGMLIAQSDGKVRGAILNDTDLHTWPGGELAPPDARPGGPVRHEEDRLSILWEELTDEALTGAGPAISKSAVRAPENPYQLYCRPDYLYLGIESNSPEP